MNAGDCYRITTAIKLHFLLPKYDYFRFNGKFANMAEGYAGSRDKFRFEKLARKYPTAAEYENFLVANWLERDVSWVGTLLDEEARGHYDQWAKRTQSLGYRFAEDCDRLLAATPVFDDLFRAKEQEFPPLLRLLLWRDICPETFVILERLLGFYGSFDRLADPTGQWAAVRLRCQKYRPFVDRLGIEDARFKAIVREKLHLRSTGEPGAQGS